MMTLRRNSEPCDCGCHTADEARAMEAQLNRAMERIAKLEKELEQSVPVAWIHPSDWMP